LPTSRLSHRITDAYRNRLVALSGALERDVERSWPTIRTLDGAKDAWPEIAARSVARSQSHAVRLTAGYLTAYISSELGRRVPTVRVDSRTYTTSRDGRPLKDALASPIIGTLGALKDKGPEDALAYGLNRAKRMAVVDFDHSHRAALRDLMDSDDRISGWQRSVRGTCGACLGDIAVEVSIRLPSIPLNVHPYCKCVTQPVVADVPDRFPVETGVQRFVAMTPDEQDEQFGEEKAQRLREEPALLSSLVAESHIETAEDFITEAPTAALT
jgi:hypothetical protein